MVEVIEKKRKSGIRSTTIPDTLIYEHWNGKPVYYRGYKDVVAGLKQPDEIMSCSDIQGALIALLVGHLFNTIDRKKYIIRTNEVGLNLSKGNNLGIDIAISEKQSSEKLSENYLNVSPKIVIEIDIKAETNDQYSGEMDYIIKKSGRLIDSGTESVFWILTSSKKILVFGRNENRATIADWNDNVFLFDDQFLNIQNLLDDEEIMW